MKTSLSSLLFFIAVTPFTAQITFTNQGSSLQSVPGVSVADCAADMDQDGLDDVVRVFGNGIYIDYQQAGGGFTPAFYPLNVQTDPDWSICAADIDRNGYTDLLFGGGSRTSFVYFNDTGTAFTEDVQPDYIFSQRSTFCDIDNDGNLDAFVCHDVDQSHPFRNVNGVLSLDLSLINTLDVGGNYAAIWCDYDNDWDTDLYITKCRGGAPVGDPQRINLLYRNDGNGVFTSVGPAANMNDGEQSWATVFEDFDNDGDFDAFSVNHTAVLPIDGQPAGNRFMRNNGDGTFTNIIGSTGINPTDLGAWNCDAADFDNNGFVDIFSEMSNEMYWNDGDGTFTAGNLSMDSGGIGDFNNDGFLDVISGNNLWINNGNAHNWVRFALDGIESNKNGVGARIEIYGEWGVQIREVRAGRSFDPASSLIASFGLGAASSIDQVVVKWTGGMVTTISDAQINTTHMVSEVGCLLDPVSIQVAGSTSICPGEFVTLSAPAGDSYTWSNGSSSQFIEADSEGNYSVIVWNEEGCGAVSNTIHVSVIEAVEPTITIDGDLEFCEGGTVVLTSSEGTSYEWSNGATEQSIAVSSGGMYWVSVAGLCQGSSLTSESIFINELSAPDPVAEDVIIGEAGTAQLSASGENLRWYAAENSTEVLAEGSDFTTDFFDSSISYWVESTTIHGGEMEAGGKLANSGGGGIPSTGGRLFFNATEPFTLQQVTVYVPEQSSPGVRTIQLFDQGGILINELAVNLPIGESVVDLGFDIAAGTGYQLGCAENNLFRNNAGVLYPYAIGTVGSIYDSTFGSSYYYYFYNWQIQKASVECVSGRVEVTAMVVGLDELNAQTGFSLYPNPVRDMLNVFSGEEHTGGLIRIVDLTGRQILPAIRITGRNTAIDVSGLSSGIYYLTLDSGFSPTSLRFARQ